VVLAVVEGSVDPPPEGIVPALVLGPEPAVPPLPLESDEPPSSPSADG
jgi:hypothetical protein